MKRQGVTAGVPDIFFAYPTEKGNGLFIELKSEDGKLSKLQQSMIQRLTQNGFCCVICYSMEEAIEAFELYIGKRNAR